MMTLNTQNQPRNIDFGLLQDNGYGLKDLVFGLHSNVQDILYIGASVTMQKNGYRDLLHSKICSYFCKNHRQKILGIGGTSSLIANAYLKQQLADFRGKLAFIEYTTGDLNFVGIRNVQRTSIMESIIVQLLKQGIRPVIIHLYRTDFGFIDGNDVANAYDKLAKQYEIPVINIGIFIEWLLKNGYSSKELLFRDIVHTNETGSKLYADLVFNSLLMSFNKSSKKHKSYFQKASPSLQKYFNSQIVPIPESAYSAPSEVENGTYHYPPTGQSYFYITSRQGHSFKFKIKGELSGILFIVGPYSGTIEIIAGDNKVYKSLLDWHCYYERITGTEMYIDFKEATTVEIRLTFAAVDLSILKQPPLSHFSVEPKLMKVVGLITAGAEVVFEA